MGDKRRTRKSKTTAVDIIHSDAEFQLTSIVNQLQSKRELSNNTLVKTLKEAAEILENAEVGHVICQAARPLCSELAAEKYCRHKNKNIAFLCGYIFGHLARLYVPNCPFEHDCLKLVFEVLQHVFTFLKNSKGPNYSKALTTLRSLTEVGFCQMLLGVDDPDLLIECIGTLVNSVNCDNCEQVRDLITSTVMSLLDEIHEIPKQLIDKMLQPTIDTTTSSAAIWLIEEILRNERLHEKLRVFCSGIVSTWLIKKDGRAKECHRQIIKLCGICSSLTLAVIPSLISLLHDSNENNRSKSVELLILLLSDQGKYIFKPDEYKTLFQEFIERFEDNNDGVRLSIVSAVAGIIHQLNDNKPQLKRLAECCFKRLTEKDEKVRSEALNSCFHLITAKSHLFNEDSIKEIFLRLMDKKPVVRKRVPEIIVALFHWSCEARGPLHKSIVNCMGQLFEAAYIPEIRTSLYAILSQRNGLFPSFLSSTEAAQLLFTMYKSFTERQTRQFLKMIENKYAFQVSLSQFALADEGDKKKPDPRLLSYFPDSNRARDHLTKLQEHQNKRVLKLLNTAAGVQCTVDEGFWKSKKELLEQVGSRTATAEFVRNLCNQAHPALISSEVLDQILDAKDVSNRLLFKKIAKVGGSLCVKMLPRLRQRLQSEQRAECIELILFAVLTASRIYHLIEPTETIATAVEELTEHLKRMVKIEYGSLKCARYSVLILSELLSREASKQFFTELCSWFSEKMKMGKAFSSNSLSSFAIQAMTAIAHLYPEIIEQHAETFNTFVFTFYLGNPVGVPDYLESRSPSPKIPAEIDTQIILKSMMFKAIGFASVPSDLKGAYPGVQSITESCIDAILTLDVLNIEYISVYTLGGDFSSSKTERSFENEQRISTNKDYLKASILGSVLKMSRHYRTKHDNRLFRDVSIALQDPAPSVRLKAVSKLMDQVAYALKMMQLHRCHKYTACLALAAIDPVIEHRNKAQEQLRMVISAQRRNLRVLSQSLPSGRNETMIHCLAEFMLPYLIYLLAHHEDFPDEVFVAEEGPNAFNPFQEMLLFLLEPLLTVEVLNLGENIPVMKKLLQCIKFSHDVDNSAYDARIYTLCDIALLMLKEICASADESLDLNWDMEFPGTISLPKALFKVDRCLIAVNDFGSHLPSNVHCLRTDILKKKQSKTRQRRSSVAGTQISGPSIQCQKATTSVGVLKRRSNLVTNAITEEVPEKRGKVNDGRVEHKAKRQRRQTNVSCEIEKAGSP